MTHVTAWFLLGLLMLTSSAAVVAQTDDGERFVNGQKGTYRGRVLDAETGRPLAGAVVVAVWRRDRVMPLGGRSEHYAAREALTDENGDFVLEAKDVERSAPRRTWRPFFTIFFPGYGRFRPIAGSAPTPPYTMFEGAGRTVELPRLRTREERREYVTTMGPYSLSEEPFKEIPEFMRLVNQESVAVGLQPYPPSGRQP